MNIHEERFIRSFISPRKQERYLSMFGTKRGRIKLIKGFYHLADLDVKYAERISFDKDSPSQIVNLLKSHKAFNSCFVISTNDEIDGNKMPLLEALEKVCGKGNDGTFLSCIAGKLGYYEGKEMGARYILRKYD